MQLKFPQDADYKELICIHLMWQKLLWEQTKNVFRVHTSLPPINNVRLVPCRALYTFSSESLSLFCYFLGTATCISQSRGFLGNCIWLFLKIFFFSTERKEVMKRISSTRWSGSSDLLQLALLLLYTARLLAALSEALHKHVYSYSPQLFLHC